MNVQLSLSASLTPSGGRTDSAPVVKTPELAESAVVGKDAGAKVDQQRTNAPAAEEKLIRTIEKAAKSLQGPQTTLEISVHEKTHAIMVKVLDKETGDLIREVPPEKILDLVANMMELAGIIVDERV